MTKVKDNFFDVAPAFTFLVLTVWWADSTFEAEQRKHFS